MKICKEKREFSFAEIEEIVKPSKYRIDAPCKYYGICGGCNLQHANNEIVSLYQKEIIEYNLSRIAHVEKASDLIAESIIPSQRLAYRNKGSFKFTNEAGNSKFGFYKRRIQSAHNFITKQVIVICS